MAKKKEVVAPADGSAPAVASAPKPATLRFYEMLNAETGKIRCVETTSFARALRHVSKDLFSGKVATARDIARLLKSGVEIETIGADPIGDPE